MSSLRRFRTEFHQELINNGLLSMTAAGIASNADKDNKTSVAIARSIAEQLGLDEQQHTKLKAQTAGKQFEASVTNFLRKSLAEFTHIQLGQRRVEHVIKRRRWLLSGEFCSLYPPERFV